MHRNKISARLEEYATRFGKEGMLARYQKFVAAQPNCFSRKCFDDGHVTASGLLLDLSGKRTLLTHHAKLERWLQLGGHSEGEVDPLDTGLREVTEESGLAARPISEKVLDVDVHAIPARGDEPEHFHYDIRFAFQVTESEDAIATSESKALQWIALDKLGEVTNELSVLRLAEKLRLLRGGR